MTITQTKQSLITSINKAINSAKVTGQLDLKILYLYDLYIKYINFTENKEEFNKVNKELKSKISKLKYFYPNVICNYKLQLDVNTANITGPNNAPVVSDIALDLDGQYGYNFTQNLFNEYFTDQDNNLPNKITIYPTTELDGDLTYNGDIITKPIEISFSNISNLVYVTELPLPVEIGEADDDNLNEDEILYTFRYKISDDSSKGSLYSNIAEVEITNSAYVENQPPEIGDIAITAENREETILTLNMFTNLMQPPYNDPENDLIDAIRIDSISTANQGIFYYDNDPIEVGDIITREDLQAELFKHVGPNIDSLANDNISFSARDEGSQIWVQ